MRNAYQPPYTITPAIICLVAEISEQLGRLSVLQEADNLRLHRINRIRTIQGSLAIEGNTLSEDQITAILDGKQVLAPPKCRKYVMRLRLMNNLNIGRLLMKSNYSKHMNY